MIWQCRGPGRFAPGPARRHFGPTLHRYAFMTSSDRPLRPTAIRVLVLEALVILGLWFVGHYFAS